MGLQSRAEGSWKRVESAKASYSSLSFPFATPRKWSSTLGEYGGPVAPTQLLFLPSPPLHLPPPSIMRPEGSRGQKVLPVTVTCTQTYTPEASGSLGVVSLPLVLATVY